MIIKRSKIPTLIGLVFLVIGTFLGVFLINFRQVFKLGAEAESAPKDIRVSNASDSNLTISWITDKESEGFIIWGKNEGAIDNLVRESESTEKSQIHSLTVTGLKPETKFFYKINSDGTLFDNKGIPWEASTGPTLNINTNSILISGSVLDSNGEPVKKALIHANVSGYLFSTVSSDTGNYVFQIGSARTPDLGSYLQINEAQTLVELFAQGPSGEVSSAQIFPQSAKPAPPLVLGQTHDFRNLPPSKSGGTPSASLELPTSEVEQSKFSVPENLGTPASSESVTLDSLKEGETVTSTKPEFFGDGPKGVTLVIKVESENPITDEVKVSSNGSWSWNPPANLAEGVHKITITWKDINGITRSLTRTFVVQAGEAPAFEASGSANTSPSPTPKPSATIKATTTPTAPPTPETGSLTPTILFTILGLGVMTLSFAIWKYTDA